MELSSITTIVFDMDGTLYQLDGDRNGFTNSTLEKAVTANAVAFIRKQEMCTNKPARQLFKTGLADPVGVSRFLSRRYGIPRRTYFEAVWNIDPAGIILDFEGAAKTVKILAQQGKQLMLLTTAPSIWQSKVIDYLGLSNCFSAIFTGENFGRKEEIFDRLSRRFQPENILSVGDQIETDIEPAAKSGMQTLLVSSPDDIKKLLKQEEVL